MEFNTEGSSSIVRITGFAINKFLVLQIVGHFDFIITDLSGLSRGHDRLIILSVDSYLFRLFNSATTLSTSSKVFMNNILRRGFLCMSFILGACGMLATPEPTPTPIPTSTPIPSPTPAPWDRPNWNIVWHDEFDGKELDKTNWTFDMGGNGWGNAEWEVYTNRTENARVEDGKLIIEARQEPIAFSGSPYSSARIKTEGL